MKFGVSLPNVGDPRRLVRFAAELEAAGWDGFFLWDHLRLETAVDPWTVLGAVATGTERVRLGTMVTPVPRRRPWKLAKEITTLDHLSAGRVIVGVGLGNPPEDDYGSFGENADRRVHAAMLDEALPIIDALLRGEHVDHSGPHYRVHAELTPPTVQRPRPPIWVAAVLPFRAGVRRARRWDGVFPVRFDAPITPDQVAELASDREQATEAAGAAIQYDIAVPIPPGAPVAELADAGATWGLDGPTSPDETFEAMSRRLLAGPARL